MARGRHISRAARKRWPLIVGAVAVLLVVGVSGAAYAAYRYELAHADRILPGVRVGGVNVSGMTEAEAIAAVWRSENPGLDRELTVFVGGKHFTVTTPELRRRAYVRKAVQQALAVSERLGGGSRAWPRVRDSSIGRGIPVCGARE